MSNPVGELQVVPITRWSERQDSPRARGRLGDREGRPRNGELDGVSLIRFEGVDAAIALRHGLGGTGGDRRRRL